MNHAELAALSYADLAELAAWRFGIIATPEMAEEHGVNPDTVVSPTKEALIKAVLTADKERSP